MCCVFGRGGGRGGECTAGRRCCSLPQPGPSIAPPRIALAYLLVPNGLRANCYVCVADQGHPRRDCCRRRRCCDSPALLLTLRCAPLRAPAGSDDMNVRVWKAQASEQMGLLLPRERHKAAYNKALLERHKHLPEVKRIVRHRHVPVAVHKVRIVLLGCGWQGSLCGTPTCRWPSTMCGCPFFVTGWVWMCRRQSTRCVCPCFGWVAG